MFLRIIFSFFASAGFSVFIKTPKKQVFFAGLTGMAGWAMYEIFKVSYGFEAAMIFSSIGVGLIANLFSFLLKTNIHPFLTSGIIPLVPGAPAFFTVQSFIEENAANASRFGYETFVSGFGIVIGVSISYSIMRIIKFNKKDKIK